MIVNASDVNDVLQKSPSQQQTLNSQAQSKAFFTTLSDIPPHQNINEFLNRCENNEEGINFLQDSEIQHVEQVQQIDQEHIQQPQPIQQEAQQQNEFSTQQNPPQDNFFNQG